MARAAGFDIERLIKFNRLSTFAWFLNGKILRRRYFGLIQIKTLNLLVPLMRVIDSLPMPPLSLIAVLKRPA